MRIWRETAEDTHSSDYSVELGHSAVDSPDWIDLSLRFARSQGFSFVQVITIHYIDTGPSSTEPSDG